MMEQTGAREDHEHAVLIAGFDNIIVPDASTGLNHVVNTGFSCPLDVVAHGRDELAVALEAVDGGEHFVRVVHLVGAVAHLGRAYRAPRLVSAHAMNHELGHGVERELAGFGDEHV